MGLHSGNAHVGDPKLVFRAQPRQRQQYIGDLDLAADDPDLEEREERPGLIAVKPTFMIELPGEKSQGITTKPREDWHIDPYFWIDGAKYEVTGKVGSGSFGTVFQAVELEDYVRNTRKPNFTPVAVKRSSPAKQELLEAAVLEAEILKKLEAVPGENFVPRYVRHGTIPPPDEKKVAEVVLAMTKLPGKPLDFWMYGIDEQALKTVSIPKMLDGDLPGACRSRRLEHAADMVIEILRTMCPIFSALRKFAFHRDISAHNFLIDDVQDNTAKFAVLDFGLAVRADKWRREWGARNIAGDPRYFAPSAWMQLTCGHKYVACHPSSCWVKQYAHRLDHYSFGMLMLEMLFALWKGPEADEEDWASSDELSDQVVAWRSSFLATRSAWRSYWKTCVRLFQTFHTGGAHALRDEFLAKNQITKQLAIDDHCENLVATVKEISAPCTDVPEGELYKKVSFVLQTAADLICPTSKTRWQEIYWRLLHLTGDASNLHNRRKQKISTEPTSSFVAVAQIAAEVEDSDGEEAQPAVQSMSSDSSFGSDDLFVTKVGSNYSDEADKVSRLPVLRNALKSGHRRIWTETGLRVPDKDMLKAAE
ncbi:CRK32 [Symbiodinium natans]|uniref:CRK32 protein n=1 Tax=Symbiodinium natans TaxID=878477 RepID=A0A812LAM9_9DINO|nr:CRK32 [Symbiodinium natans]